MAGKTIRFKNAGNMMKFLNLFILIRNNVVSSGIQRSTNTKVTNSAMSSLKMTVFVISSNSLTTKTVSLLCVGYLKINTRIIEVKKTVFF